VTSVRHSDGTAETFGYRADGELLMASNSNTAVLFDRDVLGRIVKEAGDAHWVESTYDVLGRRAHLRSSLGAEQHIERNAMGDAMRVAEEKTGFEARFVRDQLGLELERSLPGGLKSHWQRDNMGRPTQHTVSSNRSVMRAVGYKWEPNDRLRSIIDSLKGPTEYGHDALGNLASALYADGTVDLRMPDAVGSLFRREDRTDREYGPAGQLLSQTGDGGTTRYAYDAEGNLVEKREPGGRTWRYGWNGAGMLSKVTRPDGTEVSFAYDALGRRVAKMYRGQTTYWVWDGNNPLHEWVEGRIGALPESAAPVLDSTEAVAKKRDAELEALLAQGPPERGTREAPITWLFEPESFAPMAKLVGGEQLSIVTDHLGTPVLMADADGKPQWSAATSVYGELRDVVGDRHACPFRWPGQYEDAETGLYYNRFRYYDPRSGQYASQDPIRLIGGTALYAYVGDALSEVDPLGLSCGNIQQRREKIAYNFYRRAGHSHDQALSHIKGIDFTKPVSVQRLRAGKEVTQWRNPSRPVGNYFTEPGTSASQLGINPKGRSEEAFVVASDTKALRSTAAPITDTWTDPASPFAAAGGGRQFFVPEKGNMLAGGP
jgi:RHS repeat-associated protein